MTGPDNDITRTAEIDRLVSRGNVFRMRGKHLDAEDAFREALALDESRIDLRELIADMLSARGKIDDAAAEYKKIVEDKPGSVSAETKYAKAVLEIGEREYEKQMAKALLENPGSSTVGTRQPIASVILSALAPGVGQMYNGEITKGAIILGATVFAMIVLAIDNVDVKNMLLNLKAMARPGIMPPPPVSPIAILFASIIVFTWIYAVIDAPIAADKQRARQRKAAESKISDSKQ